MPKLSIACLRRIQFYSYLSPIFNNPVKHKINYFSTTNYNLIKSTLQLCKELEDLKLKLILNEDKDSKLKDAGYTAPIQDEIKINARVENNIDSETSLLNNDSAKINVDEELLRYDYEEFEEKEDEIVYDVDEDLPPHRVNRGKDNVYDLDDLMLILEENKAINVCVLKIPEKYDYCDYMVILTGTSVRHLRAMAEDIKKTYKRKRLDDDPDSVHIEGMHSKNWLAIDLSNIVVHLFLEETRKLYDLEQLWSLGSEFDEQCQTAEKAVESSTEYVSNLMKEFDLELKKFKALTDNKS